MDCKLTIFTPVYNRAYCIGHCYDSLKNQSDKNFVWMIIDDGSTDGLAQLVEEWIRTETEFPIQYYHKKNGGMYTAYNLALSHVETEYWTCIDSDDWMPEHAVEQIYDSIRRTAHMNIAGIVGLDAAPDGNILGGYFPEEGVISLIDLKLKVRHAGDMKMIYRIACSRRFSPMPEIPGEKDFNPYYMMLQMDTEAPLYAVNQVYCIADYQEDGMHTHIFHSYVHSPVSYGMLRLEFLRHKEIPVLFAFRQCIHYVSSWIFAVEQGKKQLMAPVFRPMMILAVIPGCILNLYVRFCAGKM